MHRYGALVIVLSFILSACADWNTSAARRDGICRTLKSKIVFSGATSDSRQADIQRAEEPLQQHNYDRLCDS